MKTKTNNTTEKLTRLDLSDELKKRILPYCRLKKGEIWEDPKNGHRVGVLDATESKDIKKIIGCMADSETHFFT